MLPFFFLLIIHILHHHLSSSSLEPPFERSHSVFQNTPSCFCPSIFESICCSLWKCYLKLSIYL